MDSGYDISQFELSLKGLKGATFLGYRSVFGKANEF
jgi:hypothetical protein